MARSTTSAPATRSEYDSFGPIDVPADRYWGAQTQRSKQNFDIGGERFPRTFLRAYGIVKQAAIEVIAEEGCIPQKFLPAIMTASFNDTATTHNYHRPLVVWQT